jgi:hypothetical protein
MKLLLLDSRRRKVFCCKSRRRGSSSEEKSRSFSNGFEKKCSSVESKAWLGTRSFRRRKQKTKMNPFDRAAKKQLF